MLLWPIAGYLIDSTPVSAQSTPRFFSDRLLHLQYQGTLHHPPSRDQIVWHQTVVPGGPQIITMYHLAKGLYLLATSKEGT